MLHPAIVVKPSLIAGTGLFADQVIDRGEIIWRADPDRPRVYIDEIKSWSAEARAAFFDYAWQVNAEWYEGDKDGRVLDQALHMNHSCDPNSWFDDDETMSARRAIKAGEEITYDYAMSEVEEAAIIVIVASCACSSDQCRGIVKSGDYPRIADLQKRYDNHVMSHVLDMLRDRGR